MPTEVVGITEIDERQAALYFQWFFGIYVVQIYHKIPRMWICVEKSVGLLTKSEAGPYLKRRFVEPNY